MEEHIESLEEALRKLESRIAKMELLMKKLSDKRICFNCKGTGLLKGGFACSTCHGSGIIKQIR